MAADRLSSDESDRREDKSQSPEKKDHGGEQRVGISKLRRRWELASVLNFLKVFEAVIGRGLELSAEEIEAGLITPNSSLAKLHIALLKGIPPLSKGLDGSDVWVTVLCKKLAPWWPWVAEGEIPLIAAKGKEISGYKELGPTDRLLLLKALCEIRADQDDAVAYVNDSLKEGTQISSFRKDRIAGDRNGTSFWYEENTKIGPRLYKGVAKFDTNEEYEGKKCSNPPSFQWETLATNLEEFHNVVDEFSSSEVVAETAVVRTVVTETIPLLEKLQKRREKAKKRKQRREMFLNYSRPSYIERATRSCRNRKPVNYRNDEYDRMIKEAIRETNKMTGPNEQAKESDDYSRQGTILAATNGPVERKRDSEDGPAKSDCSEDERVDKPGKRVDKDYAYSGKSDISDSDESDFDDSGNSKVERKSKKPSTVVPSHFGIRWSTRLARGDSQSFVGNVNSGTKNRLRQRPILNSALADDQIVVPDSEDEC